MPVHEIFFCNLSHSYNWWKDGDKGKVEILDIIEIPCREEKMVVLSYKVMPGRKQNVTSRQSGAWVIKEFLEKKSGQHRDTLRALLKQSEKQRRTRDIELRKQQK